MKYMFLIIVSMVILNCGSSRKRWVEQNCNEGNGYANGQKDAQSGRNFNADFARKCSPENIEITRKGYLDGYKSSVEKMILLSLKILNMSTSMVKIFLKILFML